MGLNKLSSQGLSERPGLAARQAAARLLSAIVDRRVSADGLTDDAGGHPDYLALDPRDRALVRAILASALRRRQAMQALIEAQIDRPLPPNAHALQHILHVALAQMLFLNVPDSAAVDLAVEHATRDPRTRRFARLVNAVLRGILRQPETRRNAILANMVETPGWLRDRLAAAWGEEKLRRIEAAHLQPAPIDFTVKSRPEYWAGQFGGIVLPTGSVRVARLEVPVPDLPGYADGQWWVQDAASALPAQLMGDIRNRHVADLCAAPGGKTAQLAHAGARVTAVEISPGRRKRLERNLARLGLPASIVAADLLKWQPDEPFDAILLDAPCSSTGTIRRHPDVAWTKTPEDVEKLAELQWRMLQRALPMLRPGGILVFSNCSLDPVEGEELARRLAAQSEEAELFPATAAEFPQLKDFLTPEGFLRTTPADLQRPEPELSGMDGFFAARFRRKA